METQGHPTQDLIDELQRRGAVLHEGGSQGPDPGSLPPGAANKPGMWLFVPGEAWETNIDEAPDL